MARLLAQLALLGVALAGIVPNSLEFTVEKGCILINFAPLCAGDGDSPYTIGWNPNSNTTFSVHCGFSGDTTTPTENPKYYQEFTIPSYIRRIRFDQYDCLDNGDTDHVMPSFCCEDPAPEAVTNPYYFFYGPNSNGLHV